MIKPYFFFQFNITRVMALIIHVKRRLIHIGIISTALYEKKISCTICMKQKKSTKAKKAWNETMKWVYGFTYREGHRLTLCFLYGETGTAMPSKSEIKFWMGWGWDLFARRGTQEQEVTYCTCKWEYCQCQIYGSIQISAFMDIYSRVKGSMFKLTRVKSGGGGIYSRVKGSMF